MTYGTIFQARGVGCALSLMLATLENHAEDGFLIVLALCSSSENLTAL